MLAHAPHRLPRSSRWRCETMLPSRTVIHLLCVPGRQQDMRALAQQVQQPAHLGFLAAHHVRHFGGEVGAMPGTNHDLRPGKLGTASAHRRRQFIDARPGSPGTAVRCQPPRLPIMPHSMMSASSQAIRSARRALRRNFLRSPARPGSLRRCSMHDAVGSPTDRRAGCCCPSRPRSWQVAPGFPASRARAAAGSAQIRHPRRACVPARWDAVVDTRAADVQADRSSPADRAAGRLSSPAADDAVDAAIVQVAHDTARAPLRIPQAILGIDDRAVRPMRRIDPFRRTTRRQRPRAVRRRRSRSTGCAVRTESQ